MTRTLLSLTLAAGTLLPGCFLDNASEYAFIEEGDVMMEPVRGAQFREATEYGDIYAISMQSAHDVGGSLAAAIDAVGRVLEILDRFPADSDDEGYRVYGPYHPRDAEVSWLFRFDGDAAGSRFEVWIGAEDATGTGDMDRLLGGEVGVDDTRRTGTFTLDFDVLEAYDGALKSGADRDRHFTGTVALTFERDTASDLKRIDVDYDNFTVTQEVPIHDYFAATSYAFAREADGSGTFHVDIAATFQTLLWSGPEVERMVIDMTWNQDGAGRAHGEMFEGEDEGDLMLGDLVLDECFDARGALIWREIGDKYAEALPDYNQGDPGQCAL